jgi:hypothetical protein
MVTREQIEAARSPRGGWTRVQLAKWGVPWPPRKGWKRALEEASGTRPPETELEAAARDILEWRLGYAPEWRIGRLAGLIEQSERKGSADRPAGV